ncbi:hypothetical protein FOB84_23610 [Gordonia bronchialis]|uniref:hypothetical protein n=1 Tax=Gordonia bronchialis TaxID=2054 RepID=UPI0002E0A364|nr:hypothetical protein [Gordonia bronchialis]MCC3322176.1 hypothetical protein [Gordonia bronchialis]QGS26656.1 hypothetical protein FOB84_23610 [Gordonia bronchialis]UAK36969.1 hypothetical protein K8O93_17445 [Gordonia bronchialis]
MTPVDWPGLGKDEFERIVEALVRRQWSGIAEVVSPDGRGGDQGVDIDVAQGDRRRVYQIKYFADGFSGDRKTSRQKQIKKSFDRACKLSPLPFEWILVVPTKLTPGERKYVQSLERDDTPRVRIADRLELDDLIAQYPDVHQYLATDQLKNDILLYGKETESLAGGTRSLTERIAALGGRGDAMDLHWGVNFARVGGMVELSAYPKTPNAWRDSPISLSFATRFGPEHAELRRQFERSIQYGSGGTIVLPPEALSNVSITGPAAFATHDATGELRITTESLPNAEGRAAELRFVDENGALQSAHEGTVTYVNHGTQGWAITIEFYDHAVIEIDQPDKAGDTGALHMTYNMRNIQPRQVIQLVDLLVNLHSTSTCEFYLEGQRAGILGLDRLEFNNIDELGAIVGIAVDLEAVQPYCSSYFALPAEVSTWDRVNLRVARCMIDGYLIASPLVATGTVILTGTTSPELERILDAGGPVTYFVKDFHLELGERELPLGTIAVHHPKARAINAEEAREALNSGTAEGFKLRLAPGDDPYFYVYIPNKLKNPHHPDIACWSLGGIEQPGVNTEDPDWTTVIDR